MAQPKREDTPKRSTTERSSSQWSGWRRGNRDSTTSGPLSQIRAAMQAEMKQVPLLDSKFTALMDLQQERGNLHRRRFQIAQRGTEDTNAAMQQFHQLLQEEEKLNTQQATLIEGFRTDAPKLQEQIAARRKVLVKEIEKARKEHGVEAPEAKGLERMDRFYDNVQERLTSLQQDPEASAEWLRRFTRGFSPGQEELDPRMASQLRQRLDQLQQDQDQLSRQVIQMNEQIADIRDLLDNAAPRPGGESPPGMRGGPPADRLRPPEAGGVGAGRMAVRSGDALPDGPPVPPPANHSAPNAR